MALPRVVGGRGGEIRQALWQAPSAPTNLRDDDGGRDRISVRQRWSSGIAVRDHITVEGVVTVMKEQ
jgi:hypothetical protein